MIRSRRRPSITTLIAVIVVSPILIVSAVLVSLSWEASAKVSENLGDQVMAGAARSTALEVHDYLSNAVAISDRYVRRIQAGVLPDPPQHAWERTMLDDLTTTPSVASISYGNIEGDCTWLLRGPGRLEVGIADHGKDNGTVEYVMDPATGKIVGDPLRVYTYDPRNRPWWAAALKSDQPTWTPVYLWFANKSAESTIGTGYTRQICDDNGQLRGVLVIDVTLGALNDFLRGLDIADQGRVFIIDNQNRLVAASHGRVSDDTGECYLLSEAPDPAARTVASMITPALAASDDRRNFRLTVEGQAARGRISQLHPFPGIDWRVVVVLPESAFLAQAQSVRRHSIIAGGLAVLASLAVGVWLAKNLSRPLVQMTQHVKRVGGGDFETRLDLGGAKELAVLSDQINLMAGGLKQRMELEQSLTLAMEVQKSLLPARDPAVPLLDIAGRSRYCDQTGGDYYDFIDVEALSESSMLIAVGDVMGHGIPAALVMASARAALRTNMLGQHSLAQVMTRTNQIMASDNRHNRFMTLALVMIDAKSRTVRWASGGHDPAIVYIPSTDSFQELEGGDVPLGVVEGFEFQEFQSDPLPPGSVIVIGTDGVWEMFNEQDAQYGKDRLQQIIKANHTRSSAEIAAALEADLAAFRGTRSPVDDVTFVIVRLVEAGTPAMT